MSHVRFLTLTLLLGLVLAAINPYPTAAATYFVATTGSDSRSCLTAQTSTTPKATINNGLTCLSAGDTLDIRGGVYPERIDTTVGSVMPAGTSWSNPVTVHGHTGETAILRPTSGPFVMDLYHVGGYSGGPYIQYVIFDNLTFDGVNLSNTVIKMDIGSNNVRIQNSVIKNGPGNGVNTSHDPTTESGSSHHIELINDEIFGVAGYAFYASTHNNLIDGCDVHDNKGYGIHFYSDYGVVNDNIARNNRIHNNGDNSATCFGGCLLSGLLLSSGTGNQAYNNVIYNNSLNGIEIKYTNGPGNTQVYNNTVYGHSNVCIRNVSDTTAKIQNNICSNNLGGSVVDETSGGSTIDHNLLTANPNIFVNASGADFHLVAGATAAIDQGVTVALVTVDIAGTMRPQGSAYDLGAYEFGGAGGGAVLATYYLSTTGSNTNTCTAAQDPLTPKLTFASVLPCMAGGSTLYLRGGTYQDVIDTSTRPIAGGSSWTTATTISSYPGETATLRASTGQAVVLWLRNGAADQYMIFAGLVLDGNGIASNGLAFTTGTHHLRFTNGEIKNTRFELAYIQSANNTEILSSTLHDNAALEGIHIVGSSGGTLVTGNTIFMVPSAGIRADGSDAPAGTVGTVTISSNTLFNVGITNAVAAIVLGGTGHTGSLVRNNRLFTNYAGMQVRTGTSGAKLYNNTIYGNTTAGLAIDSGAATTTVTNTIVFGNGTGITNNGTGTTLTTNVTTDPHFTNAAGADFTLLADSAARNTGTALPTDVPTDALGTLRPQEGVYDIGALEFVPGAAPPPPTGPIVRVPPWGTTGFLLFR